MVLPSEVEGFDLEPDLVLRLTRRDCILEEPTYVLDEPSFEERRLSEQVVEVLVPLGPSPRLAPYRPPVGVFIRVGIESMYFVRYGDNGEGQAIHKFCSLDRDHAQKAR